MTLNRETRTAEVRRRKNEERLFALLNRETRTTEYFLEKNEERLFALLNRETRTAGGLRISG